MDAGTNFICCFLTKQIKIANGFSAYSFWRWVIKFPSFTYFTDSSSPEKVNIVSDLLPIFIYFIIREFTFLLFSSILIKMQRFTWKNTLPLQFRKRHGKLQWALFWFSCLWKMSWQQNFPTDKNSACDVETLVFFREQASVSEIYVWIGPNLSLIKIARLFHCLLSYYRNVTNCE